MADTGPVSSDDTNQTDRPEPSNTVTPAVTRADAAGRTDQRKSPRQKNLETVLVRAIFRYKFLRCQIFYHQILRTLKKRVGLIKNELVFTLPEKLVLI